MTRRRGFECHLHISDAASQNVGGTYTWNSSGDNAELQREAFTMEESILISPFFSLLGSDFSFLIYFEQYLTL